MKKILTALVALVSLFAAVPLVMPATTSPVTASVAVQPSCDVAATPEAISFGTPMVNNPGTQQQVIVSEPTGNQQVTPTIGGTQWCTGTFKLDGTCDNPSTPFMPIGATVWAVSPTIPTTPLTGGASIGTPISFGNPVTINLNVNIPAGQTAASYTQTITFGVSC